MLVRIAWWICALFLVSIWIRVILSYVRVTAGSPLEPLGRLVNAITDPLLRPVRRALRPVQIGASALDLSPILVTLAVVVVMRLL
ncbi:MAG: YggT family protein [Acidimicrobiales bacterium]